MFQEAEDVMHQVPGLVQYPLAELEGKTQEAYLWQIIQKYVSYKWKGDYYVSLSCIFLIITNTSLLNHYFLSVALTSLLNHLFLAMLACVTFILYELKPYVSAE